MGERFRLAVLLKREDFAVSPSGLPCAQPRHPVCLVTHTLMGPVRLLFLTSGLPGQDEQRVCRVWFS